MIDSAFQRRRKIEHILMTGKKVTTPQLMQKFGVGRNTIRQDIDFLCLSLPIIAKQGYNGGYCLAEGCSRYHDLLSQKQLQCLYILRESCPEEIVEDLESIIEEFGPCNLEKK